MSLTNRRSFLKSAATAGVAAPAFLRSAISAPRNGTLRLASFGADGMAYATLDGIGTHASVKVACAAEVDSGRLSRLRKKYPDAKVYTDWRKMIDEEHKSLDIACVGTPDHMHAAMAMRAMQAGLHVYVQKPLTHDIYEARQLRRVARKKRLVTQMGIQRHSSAAYRTAAQVIRDGAIGKVREVHAWSEKKWGDTDPLPDRSDPVPPSLDWDQWLGVAEHRAFLDGRYYHPGNWRKRIDFGTATFGDMGCHIYDPIFEALQLTAPLTVRSEGPSPTVHNWAIDSVIHYVFPGMPFTAGETLKVTWYDGDRRPPQEVISLLGGRPAPGQGSIFIGEKGVMLLPHSTLPVLFPETQFADYKMPALEDENHYHQFVDAVLGKGKTSTPFDYSGPLTEAVLLGPLATRFPNTTLEWNAAKLKFRNSSEATALLRRKYRNGWKIEGLS
jgi:predicted dehydrogenase